MKMKKSKTIKIILAFMTTFSVMFANINCGQLIRVVLIWVLMM